MKVFQSGAVTAIVDCDQFDFLKAREKVVKEYCAQKGWDMRDLTMQQVMEIRSQENWKNPQGASNA